MQTFQIVLQLLILFSGIYLIFFKSYLSEKGKNLATIEDIENITKKIEDIKAEMQNQQEVEKQKRQLKFDALLQSLTLLDAHLSHTLADPTKENIKKQYATTEDARKCHNSLILTCENPDIVKMFLQIMTGEDAITPPTDQLNNYRMLVRKELDFGTDIAIDRNKAWLARGNFEKET